MSLVRNLSRLAFVVCGSGLVVACASVLGFPDRTLEEGADADSAEVSTPDSSVDTPDTGVDAGPAAALFNKTQVDFGAVGCGTTPLDQSVIIQNTGGAPLTYSAALADTTKFTINGTAIGTLAPGAQGTVAISSIPIPGSTTVGTAAQTTLTITTNDPNNASTDFPVKLVASGGVLTLTPSAVSFGEAYFNSTSDAGVAATPVPVELKNSGNVPVTVNFTQPADTQFQVRWTAYPGGVVLNPGDTMAGLQGKFTPTANGQFSTLAPLVVTGALCGSNPSSLTMSGTGSTSPATVQPGTLDFGLVDCGATGAAKTVTITNNAGSPFNITSAALSGTYAAQYSLTLPGALPYPVPAGGSVQITVTPAAIPATSPITTNLFAATLTIQTSAPADNDHLVNLVMTAHGAILSPTPTTINFGSVRVTTTGTAPFTMTNSGNASAAVTYTPSSAVFGATPNGQAIAGGASLQETATFAPAAQAAYSGTLSVSVPGGTPLCAPLPNPITLSGTGAVSVQFTPSSLDFGVVNCNTQATGKTLKITNTGSTAFTWTATTKNGYYTLNPATSGTTKLQPGGSANITVTPIKVPQYPAFGGAPQQDFYADTITFNTNPALESPYLVSVTMTPGGAILAYSPTSISFGSIRANKASSTKQFSIVNSGNEGATVSLTESGGQPGQFSESPMSNISVGANTSATINATFTPTSTGNLSTSVVMGTTGTAICAPLPAALTLSGTGF